jgi:hypothetical protein
MDMLKITERMWENVEMGECRNLEMGGQHVTKERQTANKCENGGI